MEGYGGCGGCGGCGGYEGCVSRREVVAMSRRAADGNTELATDGGEQEAGDTTIYVDNRQ